jgi:hypothetical protein
MQKTNNRNDGRKMSSKRVKYLHAKKTENAKKVNTTRRKYYRR